MLFRSKQEDLDYMKQSPPANCLSGLYYKYTLQKYKKEMCNDHKYLFFNLYIIAI